MAAMSNKERQAAFRARKKLQSFADKHFEGIHAATLQQFLHAVEVDKDEFLAMFGPVEPEPREPDPRQHSLVNQKWYFFMRDATSQFLSDQDNAERHASLISEAKKTLHKQGYFSGLPDYKHQLEDELWQLAEKDEWVVKEVERLMEDWCTSPEGEEERRKWDETEEDDYRKIFERGWPSDQFPLYQLMDAYKKLLALP